MDDFGNRSALLALQRATHATLRSLTAQLAPLGLSAGEINALANLADGQARTVSVLATAIGSRSTTVTSMLDRLETAGLVERRPHPTDRRAVLVGLTEAGRSAADTIQEAFETVERRALAELDHAELRTFRRVLDLLAEFR